MESVIYNTESTQPDALSVDFFYEVSYKYKNGYVKKSIPVAIFLRHSRSDSLPGGRQAPF